MGGDGRARFSLEATRLKRPIKRTGVSERGDRARAHTVRGRPFRLEDTVSQLDVWSRRLSSPLLYWPACLLGVSLIAAALLAPEAERRLAVEGQCIRMDAEVAALEQTRAQLAAAANALENDTAYVERVARHDLNIVRPGEMRLPLPPSRLTRRTGAPEPAESTVPPIVAALARFPDPRYHLGAMIAGAALLASGIVFSIPTRPKRRAAT